MRVLKVRGVGKVVHYADLVVVNFTVMSKDYTYDKAINELNYKTEILKQDIEKANFSRDELKTINFYINPEYRFQNNENIFLGFKAIHELKLEFTFDKVVLNNLLKIISNSKSEATFNLSFEVKDKTLIKGEALRSAVKDAKNNANIIANSAEIKLGKILNIEYLNQFVPFRSTLRIDNPEIKTSDVDITPEDVIISSEVIIEWEIEDILY